VDVEARRVARAVILVGDQARVDAVPERERAAQAACAGILRHARADVELLTEAVIEAATENDLRTVAHLRVLGPDEEHVGELLVVDPALEVEVDLVELEVVAQIERLRASERIRVSLFEILLIQITRVRPDAEVQRAEIRIGDPEAGAAGREIADAPALLVEQRRQPIDQRLALLFGQRSVARRPLLGRVGCWLWGRTKPRHAPKQKTKRSQKPHERKRSASCCDRATNDRQRGQRSVLDFRRTSDGASCVHTPTRADWGAFTWPSRDTSQRELRPHREEARLTGHIEAIELAIAVGELEANIVRQVPIDHRCDAAKFAAAQRA